MTKLRSGDSAAEPTPPKQLRLRRPDRRASVWTTVGTWPALLVLAVYGWAAPTRAAGTGEGNLEITADPAGGTLVLTTRSADGKGGKLVLAGLLANGAPAAGGASFKEAKEGDRTAVAVTFGAGETAATATLTLHAGGAATLKPGANLAGVLVTADMECAIVPGRWAGQTIRWAEKSKPGEEVHLPPENLLVGLAPGGGRMLVLAWPAGGQRVSVIRDDQVGSKACFWAARVMLAGGELHLAAFEAPGIWHRVQLSKDQLEKDIDLGWRRPFPARWATQLQQSGVPTTFVFEDRKVDGWSPDLGFFQWPVRFEGDQGRLMLGKKLPPVGEAVIFPLEGDARTPFGLLQRMLSPEQRQQVTELGPTRGGYDLVQRPRYVWPAHCDGNKRMQGTILTVGLHFRERAFMARHIEERVSEDIAVARMAQRDLDFLTGLAGQFDFWLAKEKDHPETLAALKEMRGGLQTVQEVYDRVMKGVPPKEYEARILATAEAFKKAVQEDGAENLAELRTLLNDMNEPKGRVEVMGKDFGGGVRRYFHDVAGLCARCPAAMPYGLAVREAIRRVLEYRQFEAPERYWKDLR